MKTRIMKSQIMKFESLPDKKTQPIDNVLFVNKECFRKMLTQREALTGKQVF